MISMQMKFDLLRTSTWQHGILITLGNNMNWETSSPPELYEVAKSDTAQPCRQAGQWGVMSKSSNQYCPRIMVARTGRRSEHSYICFCEIGRANNDKNENKMQKSDDSSKRTDRRRGMIVQNQSAQKSIYNMWCNVDTFIISDLNCVSKIHRIK